MNPRYKSVVLDVDSTLCGIEGIDWLAALRGPDIANRVAYQTSVAMQGEIPIQDLYGNRMKLVSPTRDEIKSLTDAYRVALAPGAKDAIDSWRAAGVHVILISAGLKAAIAPIAVELGFDEAHVNALEVQFDSEGVFHDFDRTSPLTSVLGKRELLRQLDLPRPLLAVGDGITDLAMQEVADTFAAFTAFASRDPVTSKADIIVSSFADLTRIILGD